MIAETYGLHIQTNMKNKSNFQIHLNIKNKIAIFFLQT